MKYVLEGKSEAARLEKQSQSPLLYNFNLELDGFIGQDTKTILDAGCGSGIVARSIASQFPQATLHGLDASKDRIEFAKNEAKDLKNASFYNGSLTTGTLPGTYDRIFCRFVLEHLAQKQQLKAVKTMVSALNPGGKLRLIDVDGCLFNIFPSNTFLTKCLAKIESQKNLDLFVGRKMASYLVECGLKDVTWKIQTMQMNTPELLAEETALIEERFKSTLTFLSKALGSKSKAQQFTLQYLETLAAPGTTLFYNKFIVTGTKERHLRIVK